jgi:DNA-binding XRE family transcriptional regulator
MYFVYTISASLYIISAYNYTYSERILAMPRTVYIGENLERLRFRAALSQIELAKKAGVTPAAVNRIERNRVEPQMRTVRKLAEALDVEPHVLIEGGP